MEKPSYDPAPDEGLPPVRSLLLEFPKDKQLREVDNAFLFGDVQPRAE